MADAGHALRVFQLALRLLERRDVAANGEGPDHLTLRIARGHDGQVGDAADHAALVEVVVGVQVSATAAFTHAFAQFGFQIARLLTA